MDSKNAPVRAQSGGTKVSRRTIARGAAWSVPLVAVATSAPAFAASCVPTIELGPGSCKCPGGSHQDANDTKAYYLSFTLNNLCAVGSGSGGKWRVQQVLKGNQTVLDQIPNDCFQLALPSPWMNVGEVTGTYRFEGTNSSTWIYVTFEVDYDGNGTVDATFTTQIQSPPHCTEPFIDERCNCGV
jgi:hypothetical protein